MPLAFEMVLSAVKLVLRIRDVYPGSGFLPIPDPGSATLIKILFSPEVIQAASCLDENLRGECETQFPALLPRVWLHSECSKESLQFLIFFFVIVFLGTILSSVADPGYF